MISVHGRPESGSLEHWLRAIKLKPSSIIAVVLDGSENMAHARHILEKLHSQPTTRLQIQLLHGHLNDDCRIELPKDGAPLCLLTTEAFFNRDLSVRFDVVYDDCQVHRQAVENVPHFGLMLTLKTFVVNPSTLASRRNFVQSRIRATYRPRSENVDGNPAGEPAELKSCNASAHHEVAHPLLDFPLPRPKLSWRPDGSLAFDKEKTRCEEISINMLPMANLLHDAAEIDALAVAERHALIAMVVASQVTSNLPRIFESVARTSFDRGKRMAAAMSTGSGSRHRRKKSAERARRHSQSCVVPSSLVAASNRTQLRR